LPFANEPECDLALPTNTQNWDQRARAKMKLNFILVSPVLKVAGRDAVNGYSEALPPVLM
jgi:hypothetical protein